MKIRFFPYKRTVILCSAWLVTILTVRAQQFSVAVQQFISVDQDTLALTHVNVIDGTGSPAKPDQTVLIIKGIIKTIGDKAALPASAKTIDCNGKTIIPGMIMMHEHMFYGERSNPFYVAQTMPISFPRLYLAGGVTMIRTAGTTEPQTDLNIKKWIGEGKMAGPDMDVTAPYIERESLPIPELLYIKSSGEAEKEAAYWIGMGCTSIKTYMNITKPDLDAVIKVAHKNHIKVTGHLCSITFREAATAGIDNLEHGFMVCSDFVKNKKENICSDVRSSLLELDVNSPAMQNLMAYLIKKNVAITSTLPVFEPYTGREMIPGGGEDALLPQIKEDLEKNHHALTGKDSSAAALFKKEMAWEKMFVQMGGRLMAGIDPTGAGRVIPGYADRHTLELLVEAGFTFPEAVKICTLNAAVYLGLDKEMGSIAEGKKANLVLMNGNPEKDITTVRQTVLVFKNGIGFDSKKLFQSAKGKVGIQ